MVHASLFSGIGGAELAALWMGWTNAFHCEINPFSRKLLEYHFPNSISYEDITTTEFTSWRGRVDILTGGFPCQPFSVSGKRRGAADDRYLWPEMLRAIREIQPSWVVAENVAGLLSMVQPAKETNVGSAGNLFDESYIYRKDARYTIEAICEDIERAGYSVQPIVIPACAVEAPHRRDRVWIVAHRADTRTESLQQEWKDRVHVIRNASNAKGKRGRTLRNAGTSERAQVRDELPRCLHRVPCWQYDGKSWRPTQPPVCRGDDGLPLGLADLTLPFPTWRKKSIEALGNAWVPQVAYEIFQAIELAYNK